MAYILSDNQYETGNRLADFILDNYEADKIPSDLMQGLREYKAAGAAHKAADIDAAKSALNDKLDTIVGAVTGALDDGRITLGDYGHAIDLYKVISQLAEGWPEIKTEISSLNNLERQLLGIELIKVVNKHIL